MANYTQHYKLHQWESTDNFLRTDFNTDLEKIDTALGEKTECISGSYTGNDADQEIQLGFQPSAVLLFTSDGRTNYSSVFGGLMTPSLPLRSSNDTQIVGQITETGFQVYGPNTSLSGTSITSVTYYYLAIV